MSKIKVLSFFSGGGFLDMGFEMAGFDVIFSNEIDACFAQFYKEGMSSWSRKDINITKVCSIDDIDINKINLPQDEIFGIIGGPPCQDFSIRGSKRGFDGVRGTLTYHFYEKIMDLQPDFFLMENVPGLVLLKKTKDSFFSILEMFTDDYLIKIARLNSLNYGVPQSRERLFVFGVKKTYFDKAFFESENRNWFNWPVPTYPDAHLKYNWGEPEGRSNNLELFNKSEPPEKLCTESYLIKKEDINKIPNASEFFNIRNIKKIKQIEEGDTYRPSFKKLHRKKYSPTVCYGNNEVHLHPFENRRLSVREALRLQGVPDSYILDSPSRLSKKFKMIGNGVPVPLAYQVALAINTFLNEWLID